MRRKKNWRISFKRRRILKGNKPRKMRRKYTFWITIMMIVLWLLLINIFMERSLLPLVFKISNYKIYGIANEIIDNAITTTFSGGKIDVDNIAVYDYNNEGEIASCRVNTVLVNQIMADVSKNIDLQSEQIHNEVVYIPIGRLAGESVFSNFGPTIKVVIEPTSFCKINYESAFVSTGINQVNYRIWLDIDMQMQVVIPLNNKKVKLNQQVILVDRVINGAVPNQYVNVPETENMLNFAD